jgi:hypothetical protein
VLYAQRKPGRVKRSLCLQASVPQGQQPPAGKPAAAAERAPAPQRCDYRIIAEMLEAAAAATGSLSTAIAAAALSAAVAAVSGSDLSVLGAPAASCSAAAGNSSRTTLGKRVTRDWEQQQAGRAVPASTAVDSLVELDPVVAGISAAARHLSTAAGGSMSSISNGVAEGCSPAKKRVVFRDTLPGRPLQDFRMFLKHQSPSKVRCLKCRNVSSSHQDRSALCILSRQADMKQDQEPGV